MSWSWSHTNEAYAAVADNIADKPREWLEIVWAEWISQDGYHLDIRRYEKAVVRAKRKTDEYLVEFIQQKTEELATCTNGGWESHCCPFGCPCHMVPFDRENKESEDE